MSTLPQNPAAAACVLPSTRPKRSPISPPRCPILLTCFPAMQGPFLCLKLPLVACLSKPACLHYIVAQTEAVILREEISLQERDKQWELQETIQGSPHQRSYQKPLPCSSAIVPY